MSTTETQSVRRGFSECRCICCGSEDAAVTVALHDLAIFTCSECETEFSVEDVRNHLAAWQRVLSWLEQAPVLED